jgi:serine/threonine protein phosphatase PrpC
MGAYLAVPVTAKERFEGSGSIPGLSIAYGGAAMQGWRRTMEDAHLAEVGFGGQGETPGGSAMFGVFDGHGGAEVALFCQRYMAAELAKLESFGGDAVEEALVDVFHRMDDMLRDHTFAAEIEQLKTRDAAEEDEAKGEEDGVSPMDALEMIKRVFQLKRFMGENGQPAEGGPAAPGAAGGAGAAAADEAVAMEDDDEGPSGQGQQQRKQQQGAAAGGGADGSSGQGGEQASAAGGGAGGDGGAAGPPWQRQLQGGGGDEESSEEQMQRFLEPADTRIQAGCTAVVAVIKGGTLYVANAGDSRGVLCRGGAALAMSEDHKPAQENERTRILNAGGSGWRGGGRCACACVCLCVCAAAQLGAVSKRRRGRVGQQMHSLTTPPLDSKAPPPAPIPRPPAQAASSPRSAACAASTATSICPAPSAT